jgi:Fe-S cluster biogenesis protein NfuA/nitrite reductase/ring-hydroxylating ferredoxin subunit
VSLDDQEVRRRIERLDGLLEQLDRTPGATAASALEAVELLAGIYGEALSRFMLHVSSAPDLVTELTADELLWHLLVLHELYPGSVQERVDRALDDVRPYLASHGGAVELASVEDGVATVRLSGTCQSCASSSATLELAVRDVVLAAAPEINRVEALAGTPGASQAAVIPVESLFRRPGGSGARWSTFPLDDPDESAGPRVREVDGQRLLVLRLGDTRYAYRDACPACASSLLGGPLDDGVIACPSCGERFDVHLAGRPVNGAGPPLTPVPLLERDGRVRVALAAAGGGAS